MKSAVLFLVFSRPDKTQRVFDAIRAARPPRLYVAADGARANHAGEVERCEQARRIATQVDWPCELKTLFHRENLGCKYGPASGINWFFENEEQGVILEDDVLPIASFFEYCDDLLERYRNDERVASISGCNLVANRFTPEQSYFFSHYGHIWGWASWRRAWKLYDIAMQAWPAWRNQGGLAKISNGNRLFETYWCDIFDQTYSDQINDVWDYQWYFTCWYFGLLSAVPARNQTLNIGFGPDGTHTLGIEVPQFVNESAPQPLHFPLSHPATMARQLNADAEIDRQVWGITRTNALKQTMRKLPFVRSTVLKARYMLKKMGQ